jgi:hypothetical protein
MPKSPAGRPLAAGVVLSTFLVLAVPGATRAQTTGEPSLDASGLSMCSKPSVPRSDIPVVRDLLTEYRDLTFDFCRVKEDFREGGVKGMLGHQFGTLQDVVVDLFTGRGLHPTIGTIVPEGGAAFGLALNSEWHVSETPHSRVTTSLEGRVSTEGFWAAGAVAHMQFDWYRTQDVGSYRMPQVTMAVRHFDLPRLPFYGLGIDSSRDDRSLYALSETELPILADFPLGRGLTVSAQLNTLFAASDPSATFTSRFSRAAVPGIDASTTHLVPGLALSYRSPDVLYGFSGDGRVSYEAYQSLSGGSFSFDRVTARMALHYGIEDQAFAEGSFPYLRSVLGSSTFTVEANLVVSEPRSRNAVPFYLQPTLGGGDIDNENWLRSYTNYRFRAPTTVALGVSYERRLIDPLGFVLFGQWGTVGRNLDDLNLRDLKYSVGVGLTVRLGGKALLDISLAWGDEGWQSYSTGNTNNAIGFGARAAGTVGLRGVF